MENLDEIIKKLNYFPDGYISKKRIKNRTYFYLQKRKEKHIQSIYIKKENLSEIRRQLAEREKLESILDDLINQGNVLKAKLSSNEEELSGYVMMGNNPVVKIKNKKVVWKDNNKCPLIFNRSDYLDSFLMKRCIDETRVNSRLLKKALNISNVDSNKLPLYVYGSVLTDNYWFRPFGSKLLYDDIKFKTDNYNQLALQGDTRFNSKKPRNNPQLTLVGSYEKCWKLIDGEWWLYKVGTPNEIFSEIFCSKFAKYIGIPTAFYEKDGKYVRTKNFADVYNFEPMSSLAGEDDNYENVFNVVLKLGKKYAEQYISLMYFDALVENVDRHNENLGFLRNKRNGKLVSLAPNFDNNVSLISRVDVLNENRSRNSLLMSFVRFLKSNNEAMSIFKELELVNVDEYLLDKCFEETKIDMPKENIKNFILNGYKILKDLQK